MIARKSTLIFGFNIISAILGSVGLFFVARFMGAHALGVVGFGLAYITMFLFIAELGFGTAHIKKVSEGKDLATCIGTYTRIKVILTILMVSCILGSILIWKFLFGRGFESPIHDIVLYIMALYSVFYAFGCFFRDTFFARQEAAKAQLQSITETASRVAITVPIAIFGFGVIALAGSYIVGGIIMCCVSLLLFRNYPIGKYNKEYFREYLYFALPMFFVAAISNISVSVDKVMIQLFWSSTEVGYYFGMQKITDFIIIISSSVCILLFPAISAYHAENKIKEISVLTRKVERYISFVIFPIAIFIIALASQITKVILSDDFLPAVSVLQTLALYALIFSINLPYWMEFGAINRPKLGAKIAITVAFLNILLNLLIIPPAIFGIKLLGLGAFGAALSTVISTCAGVVISRFYVKRLTNTTTNLRIFIHLFAACLTGFPLYALGQIIPLDRWFSLFGAWLLCVSIYLAILYCLKEFTKEDYYFFLDTVSPKKMFRYVKEELKS